MKTYLFGILTGILLCAAIKYRALWLPSAKSKLQRIEDRFNQPKH